MRNKFRGFSYNSPLVLSFAFLSLAVLLLHFLSGGRSDRLLFSVYRSSLGDLLTYPRFFLHALGHGSWEHYISNMMMLLVIGPAMEEKYGSRRLFWGFLITAFITGLVQWIFFPSSAVFGASGIVFMLIVLSSLSGIRNGSVPLTLFFVLILYLGRELINGLTLNDSVSQLSHIVGGVCGACFGLIIKK